MCTVRSGDGRCLVILENFNNEMKILLMNRTMQCLGLVDSNIPVTGASNNSILYIYIFIHFI